MRNLYSFRIIVLLSLLSFSCESEFLEKVPPGTLSEVALESEKGVNSLLTGIYGVVGGRVPGDEWGGSIQNWVFGSIVSDDAYKGSEPTDQPPLNSVERWETLPDNNWIYEKWRATIGAGVSRCNIALRILEKVEEITDEKKNMIRGEILFLRALFNYEAWIVFGNIPIITEDIEDPSTISNVNSEGSVLSHIINDLTFAWNNLPEKQSSVGRATKFAAKALAAKAYMQELKYEEAKPLLDDIINSGQFQLANSFMDNYRIAGNNNSESIFEIQASVNDGSEGSLNAEMGIMLNFPYPGEMGLCCGFHQVSQNLVNAYKVDDEGLPRFDDFNDLDFKNDQGLSSSDEFIPSEEEVDPRLDWTVGRRGIPIRDWGINPGSRWIRDQSYGGPYQTALKPLFYKSEKNDLSTTSGWAAGINANNFRYLRLTHILLWRAEIAAYEDDLELARSYINLIRDRAGKEVVMGKVLIYKFPSNTYPWGENSSDGDYMTGGDVDWSKPAANYNIGLYRSFNDKYEAMRAAQWEQRLEFATEGNRFFDLRRWDKHSDAGFRVDMVKTLNDFVESDLRIRNTMRGAVFTDKDKYFPIPRSQMDLQPGVLIQNPGY